MSWFFEKERTSLHSSRNGAAVSAIGGFPAKFPILVYNGNPFRLMCQAAVIEFIANIFTAPKARPITILSLVK